MESNQKILHYEVIEHTDLNEEDSKYSEKMWKHRNPNWKPKFKDQKTPEFTNFTSLVNEKIKYGWIPQGGIFIKKIGLDYHYYQAMIKY